MFFLISFCLLSFFFFFFAIIHKKFFIRLWEFHFSENNVNMRPYSGSIVIFKSVLVNCVFLFWELHGRKVLWQPLKTECLYIKLFDSNVIIHQHNRHNIYNIILYTYDIYLWQYFLGLFFKNCALRFYHFCHRISAYIQFSVQ